MITYRNVRAGRDFTFHEVAGGIHAGWFAAWAQGVGTAMRCMFFALCEAPAVTKVPNPILGEVPCCQRCADFANRPIGS